MRLDSTQVTNLVRRAIEGDQRAWDALVEEYGGLVWAITRSYRITPAEAADVSQITWLRLCENIDRLRSPGSVGAWLATTARRECLNQQAGGRTLLPMGDLTGLDPGATSGDSHEAVDAGLMKQEQSREIQEALGLLPEKSQSLLRMLMQSDSPSYEHVAAALDMPIGSIGPTRGRALRRLREILEARGVSDAAYVTR